MRRGGGGGGGGGLARADGLGVEGGGGVHVARLAEEEPRQQVAAGELGDRVLARSGSGVSGMGASCLNDIGNTDINIVCCGNTGGQQVAAGELGDRVLARSGSGVSRGGGWAVLAVRRYWPSDDIANTDTNIVC